MHDEGHTDEAQVRPITPHDASGLVSLWRETWTEVYGPSLGSAILDTLLRGLAEGTGSMLPGRGERGYCAVAGAKIIGSAVVNDGETTAYLWGMYVRPGHQRTGIGSRLLARVVREIGPSRRLEVRVLHTSPWAQDFYRAFGFALVGEETTELMAGVSAPTSVFAADVAALRRSARHSP